MEVFIKLKNADRLSLFDKIYKKEGLSWKEIARNLSISKAMLFYYKKGEYLLPKSLFNKLIKMPKTKIPYKEINKPTRFLKKEINKPLLNEKLAELLGAMNGGAFKC